MSLPRAFFNIARRWREINGRDYWKGLLDPLDVDLRRNIINYGELSQAVYTGLNKERSSRHAGLCRYGRKDLLARVAVSDPQMYEVTKLVYALCTVGLREPWRKQSNWMGFVAVATDEGKAVLGRRDVVVAWRGTIRALEWMDDLNIALVPAPEIVGPSSAGEPSVHGGWLSVYTSADSGSQYNKESARFQVLNEVTRLLDLYKEEEASITVTGHSMGAALATLTAIDVVSSGRSQGRPVAVFAFASPRVGNSAFQAAFEGTPDLRLLRVQNAPDLVPSFPTRGGYRDVGTALEINTRQSPYLRRPGNPVTWHDMECYMHGVAGAQGGRGGFELEVDRDVALVNKHGDLLKEEYGIPASWWVVQNKGMVRGDDGHWRLVDHEEDDD